MDNLRKRKQKNKHKVKIVIEESDSDEEKQHLQDIAGNIIKQIQESRDKKPNPKVINFVPSSIVSPSNTS